MSNRGGSRHLRPALQFVAVVAFLISAGSCSNWVLGVVQAFGTPNGAKISTFAGNGTGSYSGDGAAATSAELDGPQGVAVDSSGNVYIADSGNSVIRKVDTSGNISTYAGDFASGPGYTGDGFAAASARMSYPYGVAVDSTTGNLYIADTFNNRVREVSGGTITLVAGNGTTNYSPLAGPTTTGLNFPYAVAYDSANNKLYIDDYGNDRILVVAGSSLALAAGNGNAGYVGDGLAATAARLNYPYGIAVDASGSLYIADTGSNVVRKVTYPSGIINTIAGSSGSGYSGDGGPATSALLHRPSGVAVDAAGNVYIVDQVNNVVRKVDTSGNISTVAGNFRLGAGYGGDGNVATAALLNAPWGIAVDAAGNLYIADYSNQRIRKVGQ